MRVKMKRVDTPKRFLRQKRAAATTRCDDVQQGGKKRISEQLVAHQVAAVSYRKIVTFLVFKKKLKQKLSLSLSLKCYITDFM